MFTFEFKLFQAPASAVLAISAASYAVCLLTVSAHAQTTQSIKINPPGPVLNVPADGFLTKAQSMALRISNFSVSATPQAGGGYKMTGVCDGGHKAKIAGRKNGTIGNGTMGQPAIMFEFELICNQPDPTNPPIFAPLAGKPNAYTYNTNILLFAAPTVANAGVSPGAWTINATQKGGTTAPVQDVVFPAIAVTF